MGVKQKFICGFTIIELLIVVAIIGILAAITMVVYRGVQASAYDVSILSDLDTMDGLQTSYSFKHGGNFKPYYSGNGSDIELGFSASGANVIDVVVNEQGYCIRGYNINSSKRTIQDAFTKESSKDMCTNLPPSEDAIAGSSSGSGVPYSTLLASAGRLAWRDVATSSDGKKLIAVAGDIYTSADSGVTWLKRTNAETLGWLAVTSSSDGVKLAAIEDSGDGYGYGYIYTSTDSGATWTPRASSLGPNWTNIVSSGDGNKLVASAYDEGTDMSEVFKSSDSGLSWVSLSVPGNLGGGIALSSDGMKLLISGYNDGSVYISSDFGVSWSKKTPGYNFGTITSIPVSSNGQTIVIVGAVGENYISYDGGTTWNGITIGPSYSGGVGGALISADGNTIVITTTGSGNLDYLVSRDAGSTWDKYEAAAEITKSSLSSNGAKLLVEVFGGYLYLISL